MKKFDYKIEYYERITNYTINELEKMLIEKGAEGWELVSFQRLFEIEKLLVILKKEVND